VDAPRPRSRRQRLAIAALLGGALVVAVLLSSFLGAVAIPPALGFQILLHQLSGGRWYPDPCAGWDLSADQCTARVFIVWEIYLPETILALLVGAALGLAGGSLQGVFRNPLADPFLLGISSGATLGASILYVYGIGIAQADLYLPLFAFLGAIGTGLVVLAVARSRYGSVETLLLTGVALAYLLSAILSLVLLANPAGAEQVTFWLLGGLGLASWEVDGIVLGAVLVFGTLICLFGRELNLLQLGSDVAQSAGVDAPRTRVRVLLLAALITAAAVAFTGIIGFVGLVSAHVIRRVFGSDYRIVLPGAALVGAIFLLAARDASYLVFPGQVLPIGIFTAFAGVPFFLYLLFRQRSTTTMGNL